MICAARRIAIPTTKKGWIMFIAFIVIFVVVTFALQFLKPDMEEKKRNTLTTVISIVIFVIGLIIFT